jgi:capsular polysaccharide biosynthesis protein
MTTPYASVKPPEAEFGRHIREMARHWFFILVVTAAVSTGVYLWSDSAEPRFESTAVVQVQLPDELFDDGSTTRFRTRSLAELAFSPRILSAVATAAEIENFDPFDADERIGIEQRETPGFLEITGAASTSEQAASLAQALAEQLAIEGTSRERDVVAVVISPADRPGSPVSPTPVPDAVVAAVVSALVAAESVVVWRKLRGRINPVDPGPVLEGITGVPVADLRSERSQNRSLLPFFSNHLEDRPLITIVQRGPEPSTEPAALLARTAAGLSSRVLLVDADLAQPILHRHFGHPRTPGLAEVLSGGTPLGSVVRRASDTNPAAVLSAGSTPTDLSAYDRVTATHEVVRASGADCVVLSTTSSSSLDDALLITHHFGDATVLAFDPVRIKENEVVDLVDRMRAVGARLAGIVLYNDGGFRMGRRSAPWPSTAVDST